MRVVKLKLILDEYHQRRADKHGYIYFVVKEFGTRIRSLDPRLYEAKSLATGAVCTLESKFCDELDPAL